MDKPKQADVVTIQEAVEKVKKWLKEKDYKKAKQGCKEILAVEKDNAEVQKLLEEAKKGLGDNKTDNSKPSPATPTPTPPKASSKKTPEKEQKTDKPSMQTPESIMKKEKSETPTPVEKKNQSDHPKAPAKHSSPLGKIILLIILLVAIAGLVFAFFQGWLNPAFDWLLNIFGL